MNDTDSKPKIGIAVPKPESDEGGICDGRAILMLETGGAVLTAEQCFRLSDKFNTAGECLRRYHEE